MQEERVLRKTVTGSVILSNRIITRSVKPFRLASPSVDAPCLRLWHKRSY